MGNEPTKLIVSQLLGILLDFAILTPCLFHMFPASLPLITPILQPILINIIKEASNLDVWK